ncbi:MAG TPA: hypothetical protein ENJ44_07950 [Oceanospirillales bacterium]|nr:hypothetical protein [Oceanospirillales bacterium]
MITDYQWIDDNSQLEQLILSLKESDVVAFDSEFERTNTFYPKPALFQLQIKDNVYLIDMLKINNFEPIKTLLNNIILHSGSEDLEILYLLNQQMPKHVFDTQIAAAVCSYGLHFSYQNICQELLGIELKKAESRSNWLKRPLAPKQIKYAIEDIAYLQDLKKILADKLEELGRTQWFELLSKQRIAAVLHNNHIEKTFLKMTITNRFNPFRQKQLMALLQWREEQAKHRNKPRGWILKNDKIVKIIHAQAKNNQELIDKADLYPKFVKYNGTQLLTTLKTAQNIDATCLPPIVKLTPEQGQRLAGIKMQLQEKCEELNIPSSLIINIADLKKLVAQDKGLMDIPLWQLINQ